VSNTLRNKDFHHLCHKIEYYTATPINRNKINMVTEDGFSDCGDLAFKYNHP